MQAAATAYYRPMRDQKGSLLTTLTMTVLLTKEDKEHSHFDEKACSHFICQRNQQHPHQVCFASVETLEVCTKKAEDSTSKTLAKVFYVLYKKEYVLDKQGSTQDVKGEG